MRNALAEIEVVVSHSWRTQFMLALGIIAPLIILMLRRRYIGGMEFSGTFAELTEPIRMVLADRYKGAAIGAWATCWAGAFKMYHADRKRLFGRL